LTDHLSEDEQNLLFWLRHNPAAPRWRDEQLRRGIAGWGRADGRRPRRPVRPSAPPPGSIAAIINDIERCGPELSRHRAAIWGRHLFTAREVEAWLTAGLGTDDLELIVELRSLGVPPEAMTWVIRKETMLDRIRLRTCSAREIARILQREGLLTQRSA
jgi:hypothetical protein